MLLWYNSLFSSLATHSTARITVIGLCVCVRVCVSESNLALQATRRLMSDTSRFRSTKYVGSLKMTVFKRYGVKKAKKPICGLLSPRTTKSCSMAGCNQKVPSPAFYSGGASPRCGVWW